MKLQTLCLFGWEAKEQAKVSFPNPWFRKDVWGCILPWRLSSSAMDLPKKAWFISAIFPIYCELGKRLWIKARVLLLDLLSPFSVIGAYSEEEKRVEKMRKER